MLRVLSLSVALVALSTASGAGASKAEKPAIVLVHGAFEDAAVWKATQKLLEAKGHRTIAVNLPGRPGAASGTPTLDLYRDTVLAAINAQKGPVVLIGHSFGGMTISKVAESAPTKIKTLVYLAAYLPQSGQSLVDLSQKDSGSAAGAAFRVDGAKGIASIAMEARSGLFCNDCSASVAKAMPATMVDEPLGPLATPVVLTAVNFGKVDKVYIRTARDRVVSPVLQTAMLQATPVRREITIDTGHAPFLSNPKLLANAILEAAR